MPPEVTPTVDPFDPSAQPITPATVSTSTVPVTPEPTVDPFLGLVGEGKKFSTPTDLAQSKINSDQFISQLQTENAGLREDLAKSTGVDEVLNQLKAQQTTTPVTTPEPVSQEALSKLVQDEIQSQAVVTQQEANLKVSIDAITSRYGDKVGEAIEEVAGKVGMTMLQLKEIAQSAPKAFQTIMGLDATTNTTSNQVLLSSTGNSINPASVQTNQGVRPESWAYFEGLRKTNPSEYWKPVNQNKMMKASANDPNFYKN